MEILAAFDATGCAHSAARLAGVDAKTVRSYAAARDAGRPVTGPGRRERLIDPFLDKVEEWVERSEGGVRADKVQSGCWSWGSAGMSGPPAGRCMRPRPGGGPGMPERIDPGSV